MTAADTNAREDLRRPHQPSDYMQGILADLGLELPDDITSSAAAWHYIGGVARERYHHTLASLVFLEAEVRGINPFQLLRLKEEAGIEPSAGRTLSIQELGRMRDVIRRHSRPRTHVCACQEQDGYDCWAFQNGLDADVDEDTVFSGGPCECACHGEVE